MIAKDLDCAASILNPRCQISSPAGARGRPACRCAAARRSLSEALRGSARRRRHSLPRSLRPSAKSPRFPLRAADGSLQLLYSTGPWRGPRASTPTCGPVQVAAPPGIEHQGVNGDRGSHVHHPQQVPRACPCHLRSRVGAGRTGRLHVNSTLILHAAHHDGVVSGVNQRRDHGGGHRAAGRPRPACRRIGR